MEDSLKVEESLKQVSPYPHSLADLVAQLRYKPGWVFRLEQRDRGQGSKGLTLVIRIECVDTYAPDNKILINHFMIVPAAAYDERSWRRWLLEQILLVERHEACEFFQLDGRRPYAPHHGPGNDPYIVFEEGTIQEKRTDYRGIERDTDAPKD